jgi:DNA-binding transcriptional LysR family regulator
MNPDRAATPMELGARDLQLVLALVRGGTLAEAGRRLALDTSSVFRGLKRLEQQLGRSLFERDRQRLVPTELAQALAERGEAIEAQLDSARELMQTGSTALSGLLRVSCNDIGLHGLLLPVLGAFVREHPGLQFELLATNQRARLERREADVALRGTRQPPDHLVGARLGPLRSALWAHRDYLAALPPHTPVEAMTWAAPEADPDLPDYPSRRWRQQRYPGVAPRLRCDSVLGVVRAVQCAAAIGVAPTFLMRGHPELVDLSGPLPEVESDLWLLTHPDVRHLRRVKAFFDFVRTRIVLD